ncbi:hypothetical protein [Brevundimonas sp.]|uniref:hypothetical protein n=1 Tax=Brevundimonas sp. TaxID=1871086 RepID=UPI00356A3278
MAQAIASIVMNFGALERQLTDLLNRLQDCPANSRTAPKASLSETVKAIDFASHNAFGSSRLADRICAFTDSARRLSARRNILIHGEMLQTTAGGLVVAHLRLRPRQRVVYQITAADVIKLDNDITVANINLELFMLGVVDPRFQESRNNPELASQLRNATARVGPPTFVPLKKEAFPQL